MCVRVCLQNRMGSPPRSPINGVRSFPPPQARFTVSSFTSVALVAVHCVTALTTVTAPASPQVPLTLTALLGQSQHSPPSPLPVQTRAAHRSSPAWLKTCSAILV